MLWSLLYMGGLFYFETTLLLHFEDVYVNDLCIDLNLQYIFCIST